MAGRAGAGRPGPDRPAQRSATLRPVARSLARSDARRAGRAHRHRRLVPGPDGGDDQAGALAHGAARPQRPRTDLQAGRHLRRRVRVGDSLLLLEHRGGGQRDPPRPGPGSPRGGLGADTHRPGHRVRLLLGARRLGPALGRGAGGHGQLQPGDGLHRLRHLRPSLFRASGPGRGRRGGTRRAGRGGGRAVRWSDGDQPR